MQRRPLITLGLSVSDNARDPLVDLSDEGPRQSALTRDRAGRILKG
jgi:hypothetical protein